MNDNKIKYEMMDKKTLIHIPFFLLSQLALILFTLLNQIYQ